MKKKIKDLTEQEIKNICGEYLPKYCEKCPLSRPTYDECKYKYIHDLLEHFEKEVEVDE